MHYDSKLLAENFASCSSSILLECRCGEKTLLLGDVFDWTLDGHALFECSGCGRKLSLSENRGESNDCRLSNVRWF